MAATCKHCEAGHLPAWSTSGWFHQWPDREGHYVPCTNADLSARLYYTEYIKFAPTRGWVVLNGRRKVIAMHVSKEAAAQQCLAERAAHKGEDFVFTKAVVLPNFKIEGDDA